MKTKIRSILFILLMLSLVTAPSCKGTKESPKKYEKMEKKMLQEEEKSIEAARKHHYKIQSEATRKMMRDAKRRAKHLNKPRVR